MTFLSSCIGLNILWLSLAQTFIVVKVIIIPFITIVLDMFYSDTNVLIELWLYRHQLSGNDKKNSNSSDMNSDNGTAMNGETASLVSGTMFGMLLFVYGFSCIAFFGSPWLSSLLTSYKTSVSLINEEMKVVTKLGGDFLLLD